MKALVEVWEDNTGGISYVVPGSFVKGKSRYDRIGVYIGFIEDIQKGGLLNDMVTAHKWIDVFVEENRDSLYMADDARSGKLIAEIYDDYNETIAVYKRRMGVAGRLYAGIE